MVVRMRHTRAQTGNRRSHERIANTSLTKCPHCGSQMVRHGVCSTCGRYRGRVTLDMEAKLATRAKRLARRQRDRKQEEKEASEEPKTTEVKSA